MKKDKEIRIKATADLRERINKERGLIPQSTYLAALIEAALKQKIKIK